MFANPREPKMQPPRSLPMGSPPPTPWCGPFLFKSLQQAFCLGTWVGHGAHVRMQKCGLRPGASCETCPDQASHNHPHAHHKQHLLHPPTLWGHWRMRRPRGLPLGRPHITVKRIGFIWMGPIALSTKASKINGFGSRSKESSGCSAGPTVA